MKANYAPLCTTHTILAPFTLLQQQHNIQTMTQQFSTLTIILAYLQMFLARTLLLTQCQYRPAQQGDQKHTAKRNHKIAEIKIR